MRYLWVAVVAVVLTGCIGCARRATERYTGLGNEYLKRGLYEAALESFGRAIEADQLNGDAYYGAGVAAIKLRRWEQATSYLSRSMSTNPDRLEAYRDMASLYVYAFGATSSDVRAHILQELRQLSAQLHQRFPNSYEDFRVAGYVDVFSGQTQPALVNFDRALRLNPRGQDLLLASIQALVAAGDVSKAEALLKDATPNGPDTVQMYAAVVRHYFSSKQPVNVERILRQQIATSPGLSEGYLLLAAHYGSVRRWPEMVSFLSKFADSGLPAAPLLAGDFYLRLGDLTRARQMYDQGLLKDGSNRTRYQKRIAEVLVQQNNPGEAERVARELIKTDPSDPEALAVQASIPALAGDKGQLRRAVSVLATLIASLPQDFVLRYLYGRALLLTGDARSAIVQFKEAIDLRSDYIWPKIALLHLIIDSHSWGTVLMMARDLIQEEGAYVPYFTAGQRPEDRPIYEFMLPVKAGGAAAVSEVAARIAEAGFGLDDALTLAERSRAELPTDDNIASALAFIYAQKKMSGVAMDMLRPIVQRHPDNAVFRYRLAVALLGRGDAKQAKQECQTALQFATGTEKEQIQQLLAKIH